VNSKPLRPEAPALRLLVVEDDEAIRRVIERYFIALGVEVTLAGEPEEALALIENREYDFLISDLGLTDLGRSEGLDIVSQARYLRPQLRIVVFSGSDGEDLRRACVARGANLFLAKPQPMSALAEALLPAWKVA
jgi:CheY-like chemotaxis protein